MLADTHCHLNFNSFQTDLSETIIRARDAGIEHILIPGTNLTTSKEAVELSEHYDGIYAAVGIHPNDALQWQPTTCNELQVLANHPKVLAIGEIGLDYYRDYAPPDVQRMVFQEQLNLASELNLPVIIHNRQAFSDIILIVQNWCDHLKSSGASIANRPGVFHSFDGSTQDADEITRLDFYIGITGPVTFKNAVERQQVVQKLPLDKVVLETDAPFLTPHPYRGRRNEPAYLSFISEKIAELHQVTTAQIAVITSANANRLFGWSKVS